MSAEILPAPELDLARYSVEITDDKWHDEKAAFHKLRESLLEKFDGQFVAIHNGGVVTSGVDEIAVVLEAYKQVGYVSIYVARVTNKPDSRPPVRVSYRRTSTRA